MSGPSTRQTHNDETCNNSSFKWLASFLPALALATIYKFAFGSWFFGWIFNEIQSYDMVEWVIIVMPQFAVLFWGRKEKYILAILVCLATVFMVDVFRFSEDASKDIDIVFYFGAIARMATIASILFPTTIAVFMLLRCAPINELLKSSNKGKPLE